MSDWTNPYTTFQHSLREALKGRLRRTNGCVSREQYMDCVIPGRGEKAAKVLLRLFTVHEDGKLEWKPEIVTEKVLIQRVGGSSAIHTPSLVALWSSSRRLSLRTAFPYIAPAGSKTQHVGRHSPSHAPVFGVDVLVRPPTPFAEDRDEKSLRNSLMLGEECFALVIHGTFENERLVDDGEYFARVVVGDAFNIPKIATQIPQVAWSCEREMWRPLREGDADGAVDAALPHLHGFAEASAMAFVS